MYQWRQLPEDFQICFTALALHK